MENVQQHPQAVQSIITVAGEFKRYPELTFTEVRSLREWIRAGGAPRVREIPPPPPEPKPIWVFDDGGRKAAGYTRKSKEGDCVIRAIAIATGLPYTKVRDDLNERACRLRCIADYGVEREIYEPYLTELGWTWTPTMAIGAGCTVHLRADELPAGRLIVAVSVHLVAVIDGVIRDIGDPTREGTRCVYGYYRKA